MTAKISKSVIKVKNIRAKTGMDDATTVMMPIIIHE